ncbi:hypothetical protein AW27_026500 [Streptomyces sp. PCS3-D2]|uniref:hypothetical protein n=1 Tax=Streptomyces sp. PCS3-D2 TaxID=1460244 RepID=UPI0012FEFEBF|nr:hypothetical protein [Streptomyces sp. PCS3-D2]WKV74253.1 hypothetical protein AW27_023715 [Streptomyces sp. PCS3-D2]WKV74759.1 hypothetical protein AW27_026500 [Streptomyces sp. PCS3-D2]
MPRELPLLLFAVACLVVQLVQYGVRPPLERRPPHRFPPVELPAADWPYGPGSGRHRRAAPDAWAVCHTPHCAHLTTRHTRTPAGLVCDECGDVTPGGPMHDYAEYADEVEHPTREEEKAAEIALDVADDERRAAEEAEAGDGAGPEDDEDCGAEFIDGSWTYCGCEDCAERETREEADL